MSDDLHMLLNRAVEHAVAFASYWQFRGWREFWQFERAGDSRRLVQLPVT